MSTSSSNTPYSNKKQSVKHVREVLGVGNFRTRNSRRKWSEGKFYFSTLLDIFKEYDKEDKPQGLYQIDSVFYGIGLAEARGVLVGSTDITLQGLSLYKIAGLIGEMIFEGVSQNDTHRWLSKRLAS